MDTTIQKSDGIIANSYCRYFDKVVCYIRSYINDLFEAENLAQDVWVRLLTSKREIVGETISALIYKIASNIVKDYLRKRRYAAVSMGEYMEDWCEESSADIESELSAKEIAKIERGRVECLPPQRRIIYVMSRYEDKSVAEISDELVLSTRTVENHLRLGRNEVRRYVASTC